MHPAVEQRLAAELGFRVTRAEAIDPWQAHNNQLMHRWSADGREAVLKTYFQDTRQRLDREFTALEFLLSRGVSSVPRPWLRDDARNVGVYSFEPGATLPGGALSVAAACRIAEFASALHNVSPPDASADLRPSVSATFSFAHQVRGIRARLAAFESHAVSAPRLRDWRAEIEALIGRVLEGVPDVEVPRDAWRFTTGDLAPHNVLVTDDDQITVIDLEYAGWDDPLIPAADFLSAETSVHLSAEASRAFIETYCAAAGLTPSEAARLARVRALMEVGWVAVHLSLLVPERIAPKRFADASFDLDAHLAKHAALAEARLARARSIVPTLLTH